ncbi:Retrovirus-related Pol polyprotein from transposon TNT 1-94 [Melia azedarach]|uniref:Retrovirus-related Pol polyprotein from transposon TNT 1-94 n=1 Tax=Melia azedarach TaxID=155640 RepID=A0ACC1WW73_MELAZ|nr:Retrovirus-related Pol polyprotein from transposon TNT 1-94 [Melia azedarach]
MSDCKGCDTPMVSNKKLAKDDGELLSDFSEYISIIGGLQYATLIRPNIAFAVNKLSQFLSSPTSLHWQACKRVLHYLQVTSYHGLQFISSGRTELTAFADADWGCDLDDRRSIGGYCVYLGGNLVSWSSKKQQVVSRSSTESEYRALASVSSELLWLQSLLKELQHCLSTPPVVWCDNQSVAALAQNPIFHARTKHIELDIHFVCDQVLAKTLDVRYVPSTH